jgi:hypothetical protein
MSANNKPDLVKIMKVMKIAKLKPIEPYTNAKTQWKCECLVCGSIVYPLYSTVQQLGAGCKTCRYRKIREHHVFKIEYVKEVIENRGGSLLSKTYVNSNTTLDMKCSKNHFFSNTFNHIQSGQWCPTCSKGSKSEEICRTTFEQLFSMPFPKYKPSWLLNSRGNRMEIDGYCKELKIGFEYQGRQHFDLALFGNSTKQRKFDDKVKAQLCKEHGIQLFIITYKMKYSDFPIYIARQAKKFGTNLPSEFYNIKVDVFKAYLRNDRIPELQALLKPKNILVLSKKYLGSKHEIELQCLVCSNRWTALGNAFFNTRRVAGCDKCNRKKAGERNRLDIQSLQEYAEQNGGKLISSKYVQSRYRYTWKCGHGHTFVGIFSEMKYRKQFCPICEGRQIRNRKNK